MLKTKMLHKYGNRKTEVDGLTFDSNLEAKTWQKLRLLEKAEIISELKRQVRFDLSVNDLKVCTYVADFTYIENGKLVVFDAKGMILPEFRLKAKLFKAIYGFDIMLSDGLPATARRTKALKAKARLPKVALTRSR